MKRASTRPGMVHTASTPALPAWLRPQGADWILAVRVQPRASRNAIQAPHGDAVRVRVTAPPVDAAANRMLIDFLAEVLECRRSQLALVQGHTARHKAVLVRGLSRERLLDRLG